MAHSIRTCSSAAVIVVTAAILAAPALTAQVAPGRSYEYELAAGWLGLTPRGNVTTSSNRVDFRSDLGIDSLQSQISFRFLIKPPTRSRIFFDVVPYRFSGAQTISKSFRFGGMTYNVNDRVSANASLHYFSIGYQYAFINQPRLEVGLLGAAAYIGVRAQADSAATGPAQVKRDLPFPLAGLTAKYSPMQDTPWFHIRGEVKGMSFGSYGRYIDSAVAAGFALSPHVTLEPGYQVIDGDGHFSSRGAQFNFSGPTVAIRFH